MITIFNVLKKRYRCSKGHEWQRSEYPHISADGNGVLDLGTGKKFCLRCLMEFLEANVGTVEEGDLIDTPCEPNAVVGGGV